jgi:hypothetical protein
MGREGFQDVRIALGPNVFDGDALETPFLSIPDQFAIVAVHQEGVLGPAPRTFARHEMLRHDAGAKRGAIVADLDLEVGRGVAGIERADQRKNGIEDRLPAVHQGKIEMESLVGGAEIQDAIFGQRGSEGISVVSIEAEGVAVQGIGNFVTVVRQLGEVCAHADNLAWNGLLLHVKCSPSSHDGSGTPNTARSRR